MHSRKTIVYAIIAAFVGILAIGGLLSVNHNAGSQQTAAATVQTAPASLPPQTVATTPSGAATANPGAATGVSTELAAQKDAGKTATTAGKTATTTIAPAATETPAGAGWPRRVTDTRAAVTELPQRPRRIVSLAPSATQILRAIGADSALVAIPREGSDPSEATNLVRLSVYPAPSAEAILALQPDLLVGADITSPALAERLRALGLPLIVLSGNNYQGILADITRAGEATGNEPTADILTQMLSAQLAAVQAEVAATEATARPQTLLFIGETPDYAAGRGSYASDLLDIAGGENLALRLNQPWPQLSREFILEANPKALIFSVNAAALTSAPSEAGRADQLTAYLRSDPIWSQLDAVRNNRVYAIDQNLLNVPGPHVGEALEQLRAIIRNTKPEAEAEAEAASPHVQMSSEHLQP